MLLFNTTGPERNVPPESSTVPPPALAQSSIAAWIAFVSFVVPSAFAPYTFASQTFPEANAGRVPIVRVAPVSNPIIKRFILPPESASCAHWNITRNWSYHASTSRKIQEIVTLPPGALTLAQGDRLVF